MACLLPERHSRGLLLTASQVQRPRVSGAPPRPSAPGTVQQAEAGLGGNSLKNFFLNYTFWGEKKALGLPLQISW